MNRVATILLDLVYTMWIVVETRAKYGRTVYVGDSATLSYLQLIRMLVESVAGQSEFTLDPKRHMIVEARTYPPPSNTPSGVLPDRRTADVLVESYYLNVGWIWP